jgi:hypothetical protein
MAREWFELDRDKGRPVYLHSRSRLAVERAPGMTDTDWSNVRSEFFGRFPRAVEIRNGSGALPTGFVPNGDAPVFSPGERLVICLSGRRKEASVRVAGVQMPLFGDGQPPSYLLDDGGEVFWNAKTDCWMIRTGGSIEVEIASAARARARRKPPAVRKAA